KQECASVSSNAGFVSCPCKDVGACPPIASVLRGRRILKTENSHLPALIVWTDESSDYVECGNQLIGQEDRNAERRSNMKAHPVLLEMTLGNAGYLPSAVPGTKDRRFRGYRWSNVS